MKQVFGPIPSGCTLQAHQDLANVQNAMLVSCSTSASKTPGPGTEQPIRLCPGLVDMNFVGTKTETNVEHFPFIDVASLNSDSASARWRVCCLF